MLVIGRCASIHQLLDASTILETEVTVEAPPEFALLMQKDTDNKGKAVSQARHPLPTLGVLGQGYDSGCMSCQEMGDW